MSWRRGEGNREDKQSEQDFHADDVRDFEDMCLFIEDISSMFEYVCEEEARVGSESFTNEAYPVYANEEKSW